MARDRKSKQIGCGQLRTIITEPGAHAMRGDRSLRRASIATVGIGRACLGPRMRFTRSTLMCHDSAPRKCWNNGPARSCMLLARNSLLSGGQLPTRPMHDGRAQDSQRLGNAAMRRRHMHCSIDVVHSSTTAALENSAVEIPELFGKFLARWLFYPSPIDRFRSRRISTEI
jgi:hypothetical protein